MLRKSIPPPAVNDSPVLLPLSSDPAPTFHAVGFLKIACDVLVLPSVRRAAVDVPFRLKLVKSLTVPPVNSTLPIAVFVMLTNLLLPVTVSAPVPP